MRTESDSDPKIRQVTCERCGREFDCRSGGECWCEAEPYRLPVPESGDCLCPDCLRKAASALNPR